MIGTVTEHIRAHLLETLKFPHSYEEDIKEVLDKLTPFLCLMLNRLLLGNFRYGRLGTTKSRYDRLGALIHKIHLYYVTGNTELLVDTANLAFLEFLEGKHPNKHFEATDDKGHVPTLTSTKASLIILDELEPETEVKGKEGAE